MNNRPGNNFVANGTNINNNIVFPFNITPALIIPNQFMNYNFLYNNHFMINPAFLVPFSLGYNFSIPNFGLVLPLLPTNQALLQNNNILPMPTLFNTYPAPPLSTPSLPKAKSKRRPKASAVGFVSPLSSENVNSLPDTVAIPFTHQKLAPLSLKENNKVYTDNEIQQLLNVINARTKNTIYSKLELMQLLLKDKNITDNYSEAFQQLKEKYQPKLDAAASEDEQLAIKKSYTIEKHQLQQLAGFGWIKYSIAAIHETTTTKKKFYAILPRIRQGMELGKGGNGVVKLAQDLETGKFVILKSDRPMPADINGMYHYSVNEYNVLKHLNREVYSITRDKNSTLARTNNKFSSYIISELHEGHDLYHLLTYAKLSPIKKCTISLQILMNAYDIYSRGVLHHDYKPHNIIVNHETAIIDFGLGVVSSHPPEYSAKNMKYTETYRTPEISHVCSDSQTYHYNEKTEVFALGATISQIFHHTHNMHKDDLALIKQFIASMLEPDPNVRITLLDALQKFAQIYERLFIKEEKYPFVVSLLSVAYYLKNARKDGAMNKGTVAEFRERESDEILLSDYENITYADVNTNRYQTVLLDLLKEYFLPHPYIVKSEANTRNYIKKIIKDFTSRQYDLIQRIYGLYIGDQILLSIATSNQSTSSCSPSRKPGHGNAEEMLENSAENALPLLKNIETQNLPKSIFKLSPTLFQSASQERNKKMAVENNSIDDESASLKLTGKRLNPPLEYDDYSANADSQENEKSEPRFKSNRRQ